MRRVWLLIGVIVGLLGPVTAAQANINTSINWSGYAVHRHGVHFRKVSAEWRVPAGSCAAGFDGLSAFWVGLGGYSLSSQALEQVGTEFDCSTLGRPVLSVWYEVVPAPSHTVRMDVRPGDLVSARVVARGDHVTVILIDRTRHEKFRKRMVDHHMDLRSAEWIAEAPSECFEGISSCSVQPLADFGSISFMHAYAQSTRYQAGDISSRRWNRTKIVLANTAGRRYVSGKGGPTSRATPSRLNHGGRAFTITYSGSGGSSGSGSGSSVAGRRGHADRAHSSSATPVPANVHVLSRQA